MWESSGDGWVRLEWNRFYCSQRYKGLKLLGEDSVLRAVCDTPILTLYQPPWL